MEVKKIIVTGGNGFVGRHVVRKLVQKGLHIRLVVRKNTGAYASAIFPGVEVVETEDLFEESRSTLLSFCKGVDTALHLAWYTEHGKYLSSERNLACVSGSLRFAESAAEAGVSRFVSVGSCAEYDVSNEALKPSSPLMGSSLYGIAKIATYRLLKEYFRQKRVQFLWARIFYLHGEGEHPERLVSYVKGRLAQGLPVDLTTGDQVRDYISVDNAAEQICKRLLSGDQGACNICSGEPISVRQLVEKIADEFGRRDLLRFGVIPQKRDELPFVVGEKE